MKMEFVFSPAKADALDYAVEDCYAAVDELFAEYGIVPSAQGVYIGPSDQATFDACGNVGWALIHSDWFLDVIEEWYWYVNSDAIEDREDCLEHFSKKR